MCYNHICLCACFQVKIIYSSKPKNARTLHVTWRGVILVWRYPLMVTGHAIFFKFFYNNCYFQRMWYTFKVVELILCTGPTMKYIPHFRGFQLHPQHYPPVTQTKESSARNTRIFDLKKTRKCHRQNFHSISNKKNPKTLTL